ncbi:HET-domain-containing protein [Stipitochalara longipes BDJ]|nr:HET-domain-containing protein [Stipitochalara longipes BDJ]
MASLYRKIKSKMELEESECFLAESSLTDLICESEVKAALEKFKLKTDTSELATFICKKARRLFAILIWADHEAQIEKFYKNNFTDDLLPVKVKSQDGEGYILESLATNGSNSKAVNDTFSSWTDRSIDHFCDAHQWPFLVPVFREEQFQYAFYKQSRMPFLNVRSVNEGNFSIVWEAYIHKDHLQMRRNSKLLIPTSEMGYRVAVKELKKPPNVSDEGFVGIAETEAEALRAIRQMNNPHLIKAIAYYTIGTKHHFVFPWAGHGNLWDFWRLDPPTLHADYLRWVFIQLCGLAKAINDLHESVGGALRHGDLKPENILCFKELDDSKAKNDDPSKYDFPGDRRCTFVIADVGLAKAHVLETDIRPDPTVTQSGTVMYWPPEGELLQRGARSRRYDIWSLGCIYLEFIIWLLFGSAGLQRFRGELSGKKFYVVQPNDGGQKEFARINPDVQKWIDSIKKDSRCGETTAIKRLLHLIETRLLVVRVDKPSSPGNTASNFSPQGASQEAASISAGSPIQVMVRTATMPINSAQLAPTIDPSEASRAYAPEMYAAMQNIYKDATSRDRSRIEWIGKSDRLRQEGPGKYGDSLAVHHADSGGRSRSKDIVLDDTWEYSPDSDFASDVFSGLDMTTVLPRQQGVSQLCGRCSGLQLWSLECNFSDTPAGLADKSASCALCRLLSRCLSDSVTGKHDNVLFYRFGSYLTFGDKRRQPIVSLYTMPEESEPILSSIQIGLPRIPDAASPTHIKVLSEWIRSCDQTHQCYPRDLGFLPTRVLDVGDKSSGTVRLFCDTRGHTRPGKYLALSHQWGNPSQHRKFRTLKANIDKMKQGINISELPKTFQDAVNITRSLEIQYLWIDSLCIVQDDQHDWDMESKLMEQVFSSAYATIAATCASGTEDGFLKPYPERQYVTVGTGGGALYYLCEAIDDFRRDVDQGELNKRGWVLQERALSRRTIYFTEKQSYWECGGGVRCETLTKMKNRKASFLGDADFPHSVDDYVKGMKIKLYQDLYERYSNLALSFSKDRPIAIKGLETRLIRTFGTTGGFGIFDIYFHRGLLWQRSEDTLQRIEPSHSMRVPSWSWMAYKGGIKYMDIPFGEAAWVEDITSPFKAGSPGRPDYREEMGLEAIVWGIVGVEPNSPQLVLDEPGRKFAQPLKCAIVGRSKQPNLEDEQQIHYTMIVSFLASEHGVEVYERVGVGYLEKRHIVLDTLGVKIRIQ